MERKFSSLNDLDEDFQILQQRSNRLSGPQVRDGLRQGSPSHLSTCSSLQCLSDADGRLSPKKTSGQIPLSIQPFIPSLTADNLDEFLELCARVDDVYQFFCDAVCLTQSGMNIFHIALEAGSKAIAEHLIENCCSDFLMASFTIQVDNMFSKKTSLHILVEEESVCMIRKLLCKINDASFWTRHDYLRSLVKIDIGEGSIRTMSSLHLAALKGNIDLIRMLTDAGVNVDLSNDSGETPLMWAVWANRLEAVKTLVSLGASPNHEDAKGATAFYGAIRYGITEIVSYLVEHGRANVNQRRRFGLILPLTLAAAMGHAEIVRILLLHGASVHSTITGGKTALHFAATHGHDNVIKLLLTYDAKIDHGDGNGNTPLMLATRENHARAIETLLLQEANIDKKNQLGQSVWDVAVKQTDEAVIKMFILKYKKLHNIDLKDSFSFPKGHSPLHTAALCNNAKAIGVLLNLGVEWKCVDDVGNTFIHAAAQKNCTSVLEEFASKFDVACLNDHGDTALHLAVKSGHVGAVNILLHKSTLGIQNSTGSSPLHLAAWSHKCSAEVMSILVEAIIASNRWGLLDAKDKNGNTALHIAAKKGRTDVIEVLQPLDTRAVNEEKDNALHIAAKTGEITALETLLRVFGDENEDLGNNMYPSRFDLDQTNGRGDTVLHICARRGDFESVRNILEAGANLSLMNYKGNTVLHDITEQIVMTPKKKDAYLKVFNTIVELSPIWWCKSCGFLPPDEDSPLVDKYRRDAMVHLTAEIYNNAHHTVITNCATVGATDMLERILNSPGIYRFRQGSSYVFDITNLTPDTEMGSSTTQKYVAQNGGTKISKVHRIFGNLDHNLNGSCLDIIAGLKNEIEATKMLEITPIRQLVKNYWTAYQLVFGFCMLSHIIFMSFYTKFGLDTLIPDADENATGNVYYIDSTPTIYPHILLLIWPVMVLIFEIFYLVSRSRQNRFQSRGTLKRLTQNLKDQPYEIPSKLLKLSLEFVSHFSGIIFTMSVVIWYFLYEFANHHQAYSLSVALMIGWMFTVSFAKGFQTVHSFSIMLKHIFLRDIARFIFIYSFVMFGFAMGFHALFQLIPNFAAAYPSAWDTFFLTFNLMLGLDDSLFEDDTSSYYTEIVFIKMVYAAYVLLSSVVLLNLLIAMMTETYANVFAKEGTTWKLGSVRLALKMERSFPCLKMVFKKFGIIRDIAVFDSETHHWMMAIQQDHLQESSEDRIDTSNKAIMRLENKIAELQTTCQELAKNMESVRAGVDGISGSQRREDVFHLQRKDKSSLVRTTSLHAAVQRWRERVHSTGDKSPTQVSPTLTDVLSRENTQKMQERSVAEENSTLGTFVEKWKRRTKKQNQKRKPEARVSTVEAPGSGYINYAIYEESESTLQTHI